MANLRRSSAVLPFILALGASPAVAQKPEVFQSGREQLGADLALGGYDTVAYHTQHKALSGQASYRVSWRGAEWRFASAGNRDLFVKTPQLYAPQFGGYCAYAMAYGAAAPGDPKLFSIVDGKLYLNLNETVHASWEKDKAALIPRAQSNWPKALR